MSTGNRSIPRSNVRHSAWVELAFVSGSTGAVPAMSSASMRRSRGIVSVTRNSTGNYTVALERGANDIVQISGHVVQTASSPSLTGAVNCHMWKNNVSAATPSYTFQVTTAPGVAADPASGDVVVFNVRLKYSNGYA